MRSLLLVIGLPAALAVGLAGRPAAADAPNIVRGKEIATAGSRNGAPACASCHQINGVGDSSGAFPRITGQSAFYLYKQLEDYASGARKSPSMTPIAQALSEAEKRDVAGYYASTTGPYFPAPDAPFDLVQRGAVLSAVGSAHDRVQGCVNCHGPAAAGLPPSYPYLAGQFVNYTVQQLQAFKSGSRHNDPLGVMREIASHLGDRDMQALAQYFARVRPAGAGSAPVAAATAQAPPSAASGSSGPSKQP